MKTLLSFILSLFFVFFTAQISQAEEYKILVLPDNIQFDSTNYYVYPDSSIIFASDTINEIKKDGRLKTVSMTEIRETLRKNTKLNILTKKALKEFKYNYNVPFVDFKEIAECFGTDKILVITSQTDVQNYVLEKTPWDFFNIPGVSVINPSYKMSTYAALIDVCKEEVIWQDTYYKKISALQNRMMASSFAPSTEQLEKIKKYSTLFLSPMVARAVEFKILPPPVLDANGNPIVEISDTKDETVIPAESDLNLNTKIPVPTREQAKSYGEVINDL